MMHGQKNIKFFPLFSRFYSEKAAFSSEKKAAFSSEMSVNLYRKARGQISADADLYSYWA